MRLPALAKRCGRVAVWLLAALLLWLFAFDGVTGRAVYSAQPDVIRYSAGRDTAFLYFTGTQSSGVDHSAQIRDLWRQHADDIVVQYPRNRFDGPTIIAATYDALRKWGYRKVFVDGASLGFMMATDLIDYDRANGNNFQFAVMVQDGVTSIDDLVQADQAKAVAEIWYAGPVANLLLTRLFWKLGFNPPPRDTLGSGVDDVLLNRHYQASKTYPLSGWTDELRYIKGHRAYRPGEYAGIPVVIMRSRPAGRTDDDGVVKSSAANKIQVIFRGGVIIEVRGSTHIGFAEFVVTWRNSFTQGFAALPGW